MPQNKKFLTTAFAVFCMVSMLFVSNYTRLPVAASTGYEFVILSNYRKTMKIGDQFQLFAVPSTGKKPRFSSSDSSVASVNTYGRITAKKAGTATITAKIKNGEASCNITVEKTTITLNHKTITLENGFSAVLTAKVSNGHPVVFRSSKRSVATVGEDGTITAKKPGTTTITATADKTKVNCTVTVQKPTVRLKPTALSLYRKGKARLTVTATSKSRPKWKSNKKSVATVDENGMVTAIKNGTAVITVTVDGVSKACQIQVKKPKISFEKKQLTLREGETQLAQAVVSSGNRPVYSSSNSRVATVDAQGNVRGEHPGKAYIYAKEDGTKEKIPVVVTAQ